jgi:predicted RNA-binding Zn ribbon-like protein
VKGVKVIFAHDTEVTLAETAALVNTGRGGQELLPDVAVRRLRPRLERLWDMNADDAAELVNTLLREGKALPQLVKHDGWDYHLHATRYDAPLADRMAVDAAMAFSDVIRTGQLGRLRVCAAVNCTNVHVDLSKNRSRRFCSVACANRTNVAAYRTRRTVSRAAAGGG